MQILVNGQPMQVRDGLTIGALLDELGVRREFTAVAVNREVAARSSYQTTVLRDGDRLEVVRPMTGGS